MASENMKQRGIGSLIGGCVDTGFEFLSWIGKKSWYGNLDRYGVEITTDILYGEHGDSTSMDLYRPKDVKGQLPVILYIHGGAFRALSKNSHWLMGRMFAQAGYLVVNINYRLAPKNPFPAAIEDCCEAWGWIIKNIHLHGGDKESIAIAGESAGANLALSLGICTTFERPEKWAQQVYSYGIIPRAILPACGIFQVSNPERFLDKRFVSRLNYANLRDIQQSYLPQEEQLTLADPQCILETSQPKREFPPTFLCVGTWDPLIKDTVRLADTLRKLGVKVEDKYYPGEVHAFHALIFRKNAVLCWKEMIAFTNKYLSTTVSDSHPI
jgi:acetyl esterase